jgi:diaminohydroxyphosphoribosylaminopyrimidine deaminase/5-amino-6-(5-phosphoribosylamino)uracil reductase
MVGVGTILADDPVLTDRSGCPRRRPLLRVILDSHLRLPLESRLVQSVIGGTTENDVIVFCSSPDETKKRELEASGVRVERVTPDADGRPDLQAVLRRLGELEITSVMIEGGSEVNAVALASKVVDKVFLYYAPTILGERSVPFVSASFGQLDATPRVRDLSLHRFGADFAVEGYLRDPYDG